METILSIAGKPGLYKLVSRGKMNLIVESFDDAHRRQPAFATDRDEFGEILQCTPILRMCPLASIKNLGEKEQNKECSLNFKKIQLRNFATFFAEVLRLRP